MTEMTEILMTLGEFFFLLFISIFGFTFTVGAALAPFFYLAKKFGGKSNG